MIQRNLYNFYFIGWIREIVYRSTNVYTSNGTMSKDHRPKADVYYYSPEGRKHRSRNEIDQYRKLCSLCKET